MPFIRGDLGAICFTGQQSYKAHFAVHMAHFHILRLPTHIMEVGGWKLPALCFIKEQRESKLPPFFQ